MFLRKSKYFRELLNYEFFINFFVFFSTTLEPYNTDIMLMDFLQQFGNQAFTVGQQLAFQPTEAKKKMLMATVKSIEGKVLLVLSI